MDSPAFQSHTSSPQASRIRAQTTTTLSRNNSIINNNNNINHNPRASAADPRGAIQKRPSTRDRNRSISLSHHADRLYRLAAGQQPTSQQLDGQPPIPSASLSGLQLQWITPQSSPQLSGFAEPSIEASFPQWTVPTPPRSDSGIPNVSIDSKDQTPAVCIGTTSSFDHFEPATTSSEEMSSLGFLLPSQYGTSPYDTENLNYASMDQNYIPPMRVSQPQSAHSSAAYTPASSSNPALYQSRPSDVRRYPESTQAYEQTYRHTSMSYDTRPGSNYSVASGQTIPSISGLTQQSPLSSPQMNQMPQFSSAGVQSQRPQSMYDASSMYSHAPYTTGPPSSQQQLYNTSSHAASGYGNSGPFSSSSVHDALQKPLGGGGGSAGDTSIRVLQQRPKPQCWEHGCNGRQFSTFSNLLRHQREKSGTAAKSYCPKCGAEFTRTTARNGHLAHDKCTKQRRASDEK